MNTNFSRRRVLLSTSAVASAIATTGAVDVVAADTTPSPLNNLSRAQTLSEPGRWDDFSRERDLTLDVVQAVDFKLDQTAAGAGVDLTVVCDTLLIDGPVRLPGRNITLAARKIACQNGASIETTGESGISFTARAEDGRSPGAKGTDGSPGQDGRAAGNILIAAGNLSGSLSLVANGGQGAQGQQGGKGSVGQTGAVGPHASQESAPGRGGQGGPGGPGGMGGLGGNGGAAGKITVLALGQLPTGLSTEAKGGLVGPQGDPGGGGDGGAGGPGGARCYFQVGRGRPGRDDFEPGGNVCYQADGPPGPKGDKGATGSVNTKYPKAGDSFPPVSQLALIADLAVYIPIAQLKMTLSNAFISFANLQTDELADRLNWIAQVSATPKCGSKFYDDRAVRAGSPEVGRPSPDELDALGREASLLINRLRVGLDAFGYAPHYVSPLSPKYLEEAAKKRFEIATALETAHDKYLNALSKQADTGDALRDSLTLVTSSRAELDKDVGQFNADANNAQDDIQTLNATISLLTQQLQAASTNFQRAIAQKSGCSLVKMIEFVVGVIAICYGAYEGAVALADSVKKINSGPDNKNLIKDLVFIADTFDKSKIAEYLKKMQEGFAKVEDALKGNDTKLVVSLEAFESQLQPYLDMPEAQEYRDLMRQLVDVAKSRNEKQLAYTQFILKATTAQQSSTALALEADRITRLVAQTKNSALSDCVVYLTTYLAFAKRSLVEVLDLQRRSLVYITLVPIKPSYRWRVVAELAKSQLDFNEQLTKAMATRGGAQETFEAEFVLSRKKFPWFFRSLERGDAAAFAIPQNDPQFNRGSTSFVTVYQVDMVAPGIASAMGAFTCRLTHQGNSTLRDQDFTLMNFVHYKRPVILSYKSNKAKWDPTFAVANNLRGSPDIYLYVSPFAGWTLQFQPEDRVSLAKVNEIKLVFGGYAIPANRAGSARQLIMFAPN